MKRISSVSWSVMAMAMASVVCLCLGSSGARRRCLFCYICALAVRQVYMRERHWAVFGMQSVCEVGRRHNRLVRRAVVLVSQSVRGPC